MSRRAVCFGILLAIIGWSIHATAAEDSKKEPQKESQKETQKEPQKQPPKESDLTLLSPRELQVVQRQTKSSGYVLVSGRVKDECDKVEAHFSGNSFDG